MTDSHDATFRIAVARDRLTAKLGELRRRETRVRSVRCRRFATSANPWLHVAIAGAIGYRLGRPRARLAVVEPTPARHDSLIGAVVRASMVALAQVAVRYAVASLVEEP